MRNERQESRDGSGGLSDTRKRREGGEAWTKGTSDCQAALRKPHQAGGALEQRLAVREEPPLGGEGLGLVPPPGPVFVVSSWGTSWRLSAKHNSSQEGLFKGQLQGHLGYSQTNEDIH